jgi:putative CocE/NonD family hydrolase
MAAPHIAANAGPRDQHAVEAREDVLCYTSAPFATPLEATGPITVVLFVSSTAPDTDFVVTLTDLSPHGRSEIVASGVVRARYRNSRSAPAMLTANRPYELIVDLGGTAHVFRPNHSARLQVTSGSFPRFEPNPQSGALAAESADMRPATNRLYHDRHHPSYLMLHVVERPETIERLQPAR